MYRSCRCLDRFSKGDRRIMDRLNGPARLMIVSDLDCTMVDHDDSENHSLRRFNALWEAYYRHDSLLVFSSGRTPRSYQSLRNKRPLLTPDVAIMSVGTEIMYGESMMIDHKWEKYMNKKWNRDIVVEETVRFPELTPQPENNQRPHKVSFFIEKAKAADVMKVLSERLEKRGLDVKLIFSSGNALDVLPKGAGKGKALEYLLNKFKTDGKVPVNTLVCGDSGNDAELFTVPEVYGVMVSNSHEELLQWHEENVKNNPNIFLATERCADGILQALGKFLLGPNVSPRDTRDIQSLEVELSSPGYEVVKFYLFYEKWRCAEVENSKHYIQQLKSSFYPSGICVHPSGIERSMHQMIDIMETFYGDKQRNQYSVWVDRVSAAQVGTDIWLVKFNKWESCGKECRCCLTTVLLSSRAKLPDRFTWMHMHQTWLVDGSKAEDQTNWFF